MMNYSSKITGILILLAGWLIASCTALPAPEANDDPNTVDKFVLRASLPEGATKTALKFEDDVYKVVWQEGDKVSVNGVMSEAVSEADNGKKAVDFSVNGSSSAPYKVLYPGTTSSNVITLPAKQNYVAGSFDPAAAASFGNASKVGEDYVATLTHFCGVLRLALNGSATLDRIELKSLGSEKLYGDFTLATDGDGFTGTWTGGTAGTLTYSFGSGLTLNSSTDTPIYIAIPAQGYASGIEALVYQEDGAFMRLVLKLTEGTLGKDDIVIFPPKTYAAGRTENIFAINTLTAEAGGDPTPAAAGVTVAVYNVLRSKDRGTYEDLENGKNKKEAIWLSKSEVRTALGKAIKNINADIIGFNEIDEYMYQSGLEHSLQDIASEAGVTGYSWKFFSTTSTAYHYANGFAYKSSVLELKSSARLWLHPTENTYITSRYSTNDPDRTCIYAQFRHKASNKLFWVLVTQLPTSQQTGNVSMSAGVNKLAQDKCGNLPQILVGDMNSVDLSSHANQAGAQKLKEYWTDAYESLSSANKLLDFYITYSGTLSGTGSGSDSPSYYQYDILRYTKNHPERRIDHIMTHGACTVQSYKTIRTTYVLEDDDTIYAPSDHLPVVSYITLD